MLEKGLQALWKSFRLNGDGDQGERLLSVSTKIYGHISKFFDGPGCREVVGVGTGLLAGLCVGRG